MKLRCPKCGSDLFIRELTNVTVYHLFRSAVEWGLDRYDDDYSRTPQTEESWNCINCGKDMPTDLMNRS